MQEDIMSAYIVDRETISLLVTAGIQWDVATGDPTTLGQMLWDENIASVAYRYGEDLSIPYNTANLPGPVDEDCLYDHVPTDTSIDAEAVSDACRCYAYQSCEHPTWETSDACQYTTLLRQMADTKTTEQRQAQEAIDRQARIERMEQAEIERAAFDADFEARRPAWAKAVIVAEYEEDMSEIQSDYFASRTTKRLILAWSKHTRDLFSEMRKAAALAEETQHLGPGMGQFTPRVMLDLETPIKGRGYCYYHDGQASPWHRDLDNDAHGNYLTFTTRKEAEEHIKTAGDPERMNMEGQTVSFKWVIVETEIEHREKWSMGNGYYLAAQGRYRGWQVSKRNLSWSSSLYPAEWRIQEGTTTPLPIPDVKPRIRKGTKPGYIEIEFSTKPSLDQRQALKAQGFRWSKASKRWYGKAEAIGYAL
jgi:hypothetical protein